MAKFATKVQAKKVLHADDKKVVQTPLPMNDRATKRVIAPFVRIIRKDVKPAEVEETKQFSFYLQKKPSVLIRDLSSFLSDSVDLPSLLHETSDVLKNVTKAVGVTLYMMDPAANEIYISRKIPTDERHKIRWKIDQAMIVAAYVANKKEYVLVDDILRDDRFSEGIGYDGESIKSVLCVPVVTPDGECFAVIELYRLLFDKPFSIDDLKITIIVTGWMGAAVHQNSQRLALKRQQELNDYLLDLTKCYFGEAVVMEKMISEIVKFAKVTLAAERGTFFVIDRDNDELVADLFEEVGDDEGKEGQYKKATKVRFGKDRGIAGIVARTGVTVNVKDAYNDARFNKEIDQKTGFITRSILCMPIMGVDGILGVIQVTNKKSGGFFTSTDERLFRTFSVYSALALMYTKVFKKMTTTKLLNACFLRLLQLQQKPCFHDVEYLTNTLYEPLTLPPSFNQFNWYVSPDEHAKIPQYCLYIMLKIIGTKDIDVNQAIHYILTVRKLYRKVPYHNFEHSFHVFHCMYLILRRNYSHFTHIELKALMVASLCHDVDHPGFTSSYLQVTKHDLAHLYDSSVLENHHYYVTAQILRAYKLFPTLTEEENTVLLQEIYDAILSTNILHYFKVYSNLRRICRKKLFDWNDNEHRSYLKAIMINSCELCCECKPFLVAKKITDNYYVESYRQGDLLKEMGYCPIQELDRDKQHNVPEDQVRFLSVIVIPCTELLKTVLPNTENLCKDARLLRQTWQDIIDIRGKKCWRQDDSIVEKVYV